MQKHTPKVWDVLTIFPDLVNSFAKIGIIERAIKQKLIKITPIDLRKFGEGDRQAIDGRPYGGGVGMVLRPDILYKGISQWKRKHKGKKSIVCLLSPQGKVFDHKLAKRFADYDSVLLVCGRYEGFDERIRKFVDLEVSIGDYILMGGELPALVILESSSRFIPGVVGKFESTQGESFEEGKLEYPQYTKPESWRVKGKNYKVPGVLLTGHHKKIEEWRNTESLKRTKKRRPDLLS